MDAVHIDSDCQPRSYCIRDGVHSSPGAVPIISIIGVVLIVIGCVILWNAWSGFGPERDMDLSWLMWGISQFGFGIALTVGAGMTLLGLALVGLIVASQTVPASTTWRLDGSGLYGINEIGRLRRSRPTFFPFERIAAINQTKDCVSLYLWQDGKSTFERDLAKGLPLELAASLAQCLHEDLTAARAQWQDQGLQLVAHSPASPGARRNQDGTHGTPAHPA